MYNVRTCASGFAKVVTIKFCLNGHEHLLIGGRLWHMYMYNIHTCSIPVHTCMYIHVHTCTYMYVHTQYLYESQDSEGWLNSQRDDASDYGQYTNHWEHCLP